MMSTGLTRVTTGRLTQVAQTLEDLRNQYNQAVERFYNCGAEIDAMWDGDASQRFNLILAQDRTGFNEMAVILARYIEILRQDAQTYERAEGDVTNVLTQKTYRK